MKKISYNIEFYKICTIALYLVFNFINRDISNIFLILALLLSIIDYKKLLESVREHEAVCKSVVLFSIWILSLGVMSSSPAHELDNYFRLLFLLPLLSINLTEKILYRLILVITLSALAHYFHLLDFTFNSPFIETDNRYQGTASNQITYANLLMTIIILAIYLLTRSSSLKNNLFLIASIIVLTFLFSETGTRGPLISLIISFFIMIFLTKNIKISVFPLIFFSIIILTPNGLSDRLSGLTSLSESKDESINERIFYLKYGLESISKHPVFGVGPHNIESNLSDYLDQKNLKYEPRDHLHNEYLDITAKFGLPAFLLLLTCYYFFYFSVRGENSKIVLFILVSLIASQLTQSHFAHHQAITFFITLIYLFLSKKSHV